MAKKVVKQTVFSSGYRFLDAKGKSIAILDQDGRFTLKDENASIETFPSWADFVRQFEEKPTTGDEDAILAQLESMTMGKSEIIDASTSPTGPAAAPSEAEIAKKKENIEVAKKTAPAKKKAAPSAKREKVVKEQQPCVCGCGTMVNKNFAQGHDARVHGWGKKIARGDMKFSEIGSADYPSKDPQRAVKFLKTEMGIVQGTATK